MTSQPEQLLGNNLIIQLQSGIYARVLCIGSVIIFSLYTQTTDSSVYD